MGLTGRAILKGAQQAKIAANELTSNPAYTLKLLKSKRIHAGVDDIQPLVVTNWPIFSGWRIVDVPVLGLGELMSILRGGKVKYFKGTDILSEDSYCAADAPSAEEFLAFLKQTVAFRVADNTFRIEHVSAGPSPIDLRFPWVVPSVETSPA